jgi:hypothetical protein
VPEQELLRPGNGWVTAIPIPSRVRQELRLCLCRLGLAIGNTLNVELCRGLAISGWPSLPAEDDRNEPSDGIDASLLGGRKLAQVSLAFVPPSKSNDPGGRAGVRRLSRRPRQHAGRIDGGCLRCPEPRGFTP